MTTDPKPKKGTDMKERTILFSAPMVRAILEGRKTMTRRVMKGQPHTHRIAGFGFPTLKGGFVSKEAILADCPYGQPGDRLWVREAWRYYDWTEDGAPMLEFRADGKTGPWCYNTPLDWVDRLESVWIELSAPENFSVDGRASDKRWRPSINMPRWASRITLEITGVRAERVQDISEKDAAAEGVYLDDTRPEEQDFKTKSHLCPKCAGTGLYTGVGPSLGVIFDLDCYNCDTDKKKFSNLWEFLNGPASWDSNPWVWVVEFRVILIEF